MTALAHKDTMSSREIARIAGKRHTEVLRAIRNMEKAWVKVSQRKFASAEYSDEQGKPRPEYQLNKYECLYIATKFNDEARAKLVMRWAELEEKEQNVETEYREPLKLESPTKSYREQAKEKQRELMQVIRSYLKHGDITDVAHKIGKRYDTVKDVLNCHYKNKEIINALYQRAMKNKENLLIDYDTMIEELKK